MFFRKKHTFILTQNKDLLTDSLKTAVGKKQVYQHTFGESVYDLQLDYDRWIISSRHQILRGIKMKPDAYIRLTPISERMTQAEVFIKLSAIWLLFLIFMHLAIICVFFFPPNTAVTIFGKDLGPDWLNRAVVVLCNITLFNLFIWITFRIETTRLKKIIEKLFGAGQMV